NRCLSTALLLSLSATMAFGCGAGDDAQPGDEDDLTSVTARERTMSFDGYVYVDADASDYEILAAVKRQNKSAFGALRTAQISANNRELAEVDAQAFVKEPITIVDPSKPNSTGTKALRVHYRYTDRALVPKSLSKRGAVSLALLAGDYQVQSKRILQECTE